MPTKGDWDFYSMASNFFKKPKVRIAIATLITIFTLATTFSASFAWFESLNMFNTTAGNFTVFCPEAIGFDLYYLSEFDDGEGNTKLGNYNPTIESFSGYEVAYEDATFTKINYSDGHVTNDPNPTNITHLWPAHKLTFAVVITSSEVEKFSISDWGENEGHEADDAAKTSVSQFVRLSWAIDIYGAAYSVTSTGDTDEAIANDVATGFRTYYADDTLEDVFEYSEESLAPTSSKPVIDIIESGDMPEKESGHRVIIYFTLEFSNDVNTHYSYDEETGYYEQDDYGNSNCYERLFFDKLDFELA